MELITCASRGPILRTERVFLDRKHVGEAEPADWAIYFGAGLGVLALIVQAHAAMLQRRAAAIVGIGL